MIHLRMEGSIEPPFLLGPAPWFRVDDKFIRQGPHGAIVGSFRRHIWEVQSKQYARYHCMEPHSIRFEDPAKPEGIALGEFLKTWVEDGILHPDNTLRARFNQDIHLWSILIIESAAQPS